MHTSNLLMRLGASLVCAAGIANSAYTITDTFDHTNFFTDFSFFTAADPTDGFVKFASATAANSSGLAGYSNNAVYLGVDHTTVNPSGGRGSVRVTSNKAYTKGLFIADIAHMPDSTCGVWPAFWTFGPNWPSSGEIDIIEGVNDETTDTVTLHTSSGCTMQSTGAVSSSVLGTTDCGASGGNTGCGFNTANTANFGSGFNAGGGGVYAMEWTSTAIKVFFFPRSAIPADITSGKPNTANWTNPIAAFGGGGCNIDQHFQNHNIVFDTTFCGSWAGQVWDENAKCKALASTCDAYVGSNPAAFASSYWLVNSVKVYSASAAKRGVAFEG
ncbi:Endo-1,3(4)-beta-glucanase [Lachnellula suecica]|uniref:endo-1,3(4)-beta-glucanase n=1 Tax=Lachnellula suecica TaxID=602035 RepID=A0A8T9C6X7_9HELO|nr:Endo-1,3(4)-beta-glucanase [Lachnellula suecica]